MKTYAFTHAGRGRRRNGDHYLIKQMKDGSNLLAVADGMCGDTPGNRAAQIAKDMLAGTELGAWGNDFRLRYLVKKIDSIVYDHTRTDTSLEGIGTTITAVFLHRGIASWVNVGDSRLYMWRDRKLVQVTSDQNMSRLNAVPEEKTSDGNTCQKDTPALSEGCRCVGFGKCEPATGCMPLKRDDLLLLATDGFHEAMPVETLLSLLKTSKPIESIAVDMNRALMETGCDDDATVVMAQL